MFQFNDIWEIVDDRVFSLGVFKTIDYTEIWPPRAAREELCKQCRSMDLLARNFIRHDSVAGLKDRGCKLCSLFYNSISKHWDKWHDPDIHFYLIDSAFRMDYRSPPVLSVYCHPGMLVERISICHI